MKNILRTFKSPKVLIVTLLVSVASVQESHAFVWFGAEEKSLGSQYAYNDVCVEIVEVNTYFFGIIVKSEIQQRPFRCNGGGPQ
ncbi:hypothetical protein LV89_04913 [Arcicella aurantiaca]|uniref:Uncharacterized protein n=1 Tax=Arcicella aurantiaca TaxID=591202 RepID=A0A316DEY2_9BACT|nr:hypothetical protein [Arcicella aurantiaca]PWK16138.1 hypothetical protein LV89_04913 [Arcicella aurantiaca]